jgi:hypothetical protein
LLFASSCTSFEATPAEPSRFEKGRSTPSKTSTSTSPRRSTRGIRSRHSRGTRSRYISGGGFT